MKAPFDPEAFELAKDRAGGSEAALARATGLSQVAINKAARAGRVSAELAIRIESATGVPRWRLRPDLWTAPEQAGAA
jgi:DNA-binding transcriptional regulator YdaS (Cro superfamily)